MEMEKERKNLPIWVYACLFFGVVILIGGLLFLVCTPNESQYACRNMNGEKIDPTPDLCKWAYENLDNNFSDMKYHAAEISDCCKTRGIKASENSYIFHPRIYVINSDGSNGEDISCEYYPNDVRCKS